MKKASRNQSTYAWILLLCYAVMLWVSPFHTHDCCHEHDRTETEAAGAVHANIPAHLASVAKAYLSLSSTVPQLCLDHQCCVGADLRDCDQTQFLPRSRLALETDYLQELLPALVSFGNPELDFGSNCCFEKLRVCALLPFLTSIRSVRLLI